MSKKEAVQEDTANRKSTKLKHSSLNIAGHKGKEWRIKEIVEEENLDFLGMQETWLRPQDQTRLLYISRQITPLMSGRLLEEPKRKRRNNDYNESKNHLHKATHGNDF